MRRLYFANDEAWSRKASREMRTVELNILGQRYKVRSDEGDGYLQSLAQFINDQVAEVQKSANTVSTHNTTILAALNITDTLFKLREENSLLKKEVRERLRRVLKMIRATSGDEEIEGS
jgi:cell division protein ZapA